MNDLSIRKRDKEWAVRNMLKDYEAMIDFIGAGLSAGVGRENEGDKAYAFGRLCSMRDFYEGLCSSINEEVVRNGDGHVDESAYRKKESETLEEEVLKLREFVNARGIVWNGAEESVYSVMPIAYLVRVMIGKPREEKVGECVRSRN